MLLLANQASSLGVVCVCCVCVSACVSVCVCGCVYVSVCVCVCVCYLRSGAPSWFRALLHRPRYFCRARDTGMCARYKYVRVRVCVRERGGYMAGSDHQIDAITTKYCDFEHHREILKGEIFFLGVS